MILVVDNYDSFVYNLARYVHQLCAEEVKVVRNDVIELDSLGIEQISALIISPGPCGPSQCEQVVGLVRSICDRVPILGVCLGHQVISHSFGGMISRSINPMHGKSSLITHDNNSPLFRDIPNPFVAGRYHSLIAEADSLPSAFRVTAKSDDGTIMAIQHKTLPVYGIQFHPESVLTECGYQLMHNFLTIADVDPVAPDKQKIFA